MGGWRSTPKGKYRERTEVGKHRDRREARWRQRMCPKLDRKYNSKDDDTTTTTTTTTTSVDHISMLPDELLSSILSCNCITSKEQIATSILSRRRRYLWTFTTRLDFEAIDSLLSIEWGWPWRFYRGRHAKILSALDKIKLDFLTRVNHVIASRRPGLPLEEFKLYFDLGKQDEVYINKWLSYALAWKIQRLELNFNTTLIPSVYECYVFPDTFFSHNPMCFKHLKVISLNYVDVDSKALEFFLHNCPLLEDLSVTESSKLLSLRVAGPFPSLKRLEISNCYLLDSLEICDVNLVSFKYVRREIPFVLLDILLSVPPPFVLLQNVPMLAHLSITRSTLVYMKLNIPQFSSILEQLEIFKVDLESCKKSFVIPVEMSNLRQLEVVASSLSADQSLLWLADLIQSAPHLRKFVLLSHRGAAPFRRRKLQRIKLENSYGELEEVEFVGFCGVPSDVEFILHFVDNAAALKKIIVHTKTLHKSLITRKFGPNHANIYKQVHHELEEKLALKKRRIKLEFLITPFSG